MLIYNILYFKNLFEKKRTSKAEARPSLVLSRSIMIYKDFDSLEVAPAKLGTVIADGYSMNIE
jgi:hypothetical protein